MTKEEKVTFEYEDDQYHKPTEYFSKDVDLLFLIIFLEVFHRGDTVVGLGNFFKGDGFDMDYDVCDEIMDMNDYYAVADKIMEQIAFIFEDIRMGKVLAIGIDDLDDTLEDLFIEAARIGEKEMLRAAYHFRGIAEQICYFKDIKNKEYDAEIEANPDSMREIFDRKRNDKSIFFSAGDHFRKLQEIAVETPSHISFKLAFNKGKAKEIEEQMEKFLVDFSQDKLTENDKRLHFSRQIENFYNYVSKLHFVGDVVNIPFAILLETNFEAVKILKYLEMRKVIETRWSDEGSWMVRFKKLPITPENLVGSDNVTALPIANTNNSLYENKISIQKLDLILDKRTGSFTFGDTNGQFNPRSPECKVLFTLMECEDNFADYEKLITAMGRQYQKASFKSQNRDLGLVIRNIKRTLGILPKSKNSNKDVLKNTKGVGYNLSP